MNYDDTNIFAKILRGEIPCQKVFEDDQVLAFRDINPQRPVHVLVIPRGSWRSLADFGHSAGDEEITAFVRAVAAVARQLGLEGDGYRVIFNIGANGGQEVDHLHAHILGGAPVGPMVS